MVEHEPVPYSSGDIEELGLKYKTEQDLFETLVESGEQWLPQQQRMVSGAYSLARILHKDDTHRNLPYTYHLLRNANRVTGYLHMTDPEIITAVILHDSVEDHPDEIIRSATFGANLSPIKVPTPESAKMKQQVALKTLEALFSPRVAKLVASVTNEPAIKGEEISYEDWLMRYANKVSNAVTDPDSWMIKFVDWLDNGVGILHSDRDIETNKIQHFRRKYGLIQPILEQRYKESDIQVMLDSTAKAYVEHQFQLGKERLTKK